MPIAIRGRRSEVLQWGRSFFARWILVPQNLYKELKQMIYQRKRDLMMAWVDRNVYMERLWALEGAQSRLFIDEV